MIINFGNFGGGGGGSSEAVWGAIGGTITNQTDLVEYIDNRIGDLQEIITEMTNSVGE